jgi:hypothetical protein
MTDSNVTEATSGPRSVKGKQSLEEAAEGGQLPGIEDVEQAEQEGRDTSEAAATDATEAEGDPLAGGAILGKISQSR